MLVLCLCMYELWMLGGMTIMEKCIIEPRHTSRPPVKEQASVLVLCLCMYELWMSGGKGGILIIGCTGPVRAASGPKDLGLGGPLARPEVTAATCRRSQRGEVWARRPARGGDPHDVA